MCCTVCSGFVVVVGACARTCALDNGVGVGADAGGITAGGVTTETAGGCGETNALWMLVMS